MKPAVVNSLTERKVEVLRRFNSSVESVWKPFTDASLVRQWMLGPPGWSMPICEMDFRIKGFYEIVFQNEDESTKITIVGTFREIITQQKIVQDEQHKIGNFEGGITNKTVITITFEPVGHATNVRTLIKYDSQKQRDEALATGMGAAMEMGYRRIDDILRS